PATIDIAANASDGDGTVSKVEFYNGTTKLGEDLTSPYSYSWTNVAAGPYTLTARATDNGNAVTTSAAVSVTVNSSTSTNCPCSVFRPTDAPANVLYNDGQALQVGMKFRSSSSGSVTGVRFYKQSGNTGTHVGQLHSSTGTLLAQATFVNETASGWQQVLFSSPVAISANTTYVVSYHSSAGYYSAVDQGFSQAVVNGPLTGLANGADGSNGLYRYTGTPAFPTSAYQASNYWVDVVFNTSTTISSSSSSSVITSKTTELQEKEDINVYPNPFSGKATVSFILNVGGNYTLSLYDTKGAKVSVLEHGKANPGERHKVEVDGSKLSRGIYIVRLQTISGVRTTQLLLEK
ncbi:DUF4082 domain-containing protein, partial [Pontibacter pamirensis]|uniref:DUF4082 domain-containing protein n=1 Tax=Pontibacter pamirensis TaxID=2562824 RepID=UPI0013899523